MNKQSHKKNRVSEFYDLSERLLNSGDAYWGNLGYWQEGDDYSKACENLAHCLASAVGLNECSRVFDAGFGSGDQLLLWLKEYRIQFLCGINYSCSQTILAKQRIQQQVPFRDSDQSSNNLTHGEAGYSDFIIQGDVADLNSSRVVKHKDINTVLALDCAYHFPSREAFFKDCFQMLEPTKIKEQALESTKGSVPRIGLTDIVLASSELNWFKRRVLNLMLKFSQIPQRNIVTLEEYKRQLQGAGFSHITSQDISEAVFEPFGNWIKLNKQAAENLRGNRLAWLKYRVTGKFLTWAYRENVLRYIVIGAR